MVQHGESLTLCSAQHQKAIVAKEENCAHLPMPQSEPGQCFPATSWRWRCSLMENALLTHLWTSHGTHTQRSLWDQCIPLSLKTAALPILGLQAPADASCCGIIIRCLSARSPQNFSLTCLGCHLTALHIMFSFFRKLRIQGTGSTYENQTPQCRRQFFAHLEMLSHLPSLFEEPCDFPLHSSALQAGAEAIPHRLQDKSRRGFPSHRPKP